MDWIKRLTSFSCIVLMFVFSLISCQSDVSCPTSEQCLRDPADCTSSANCKFIAFYRYDFDNAELVVTLGSNQRWVAFTQVAGAPNRMAGIRGEVCSRDGSAIPQLQSITASNPTGAPTYHGVIQGVNLTEALVSSSSSIICHYRKTITPQDTSLNYDLSTPRSIVYAYGSTVSSGQPGYHGSGNTGIITARQIFIPSDVSCPSNDNCYKQPSTCTSSADCDAIIFYQYNSAGQEFGITIGSRHKWVGFTQVPAIVGNAMNGIRGEVCFNLRSVPKLASLNATGRTNPNFQNMAEGITLVEAVITTSGSIVCRYRRRVSPPAASVSLYYNLIDPHHIVYAYGENVGQSYPSYHQPRNYSFTQTPVVFVPLVDVSCPSSERCYRSPNDCTSSDDCNAIIFYEYNSNTEELDITIGSKLNWIGFTQVPNLGSERMAGIRGEACFNLNSTGRLASLTAANNTLPNFHSLAEGISVVYSAITGNGSIVCRYRRKIAPPSENVTSYYNLNRPHHIVYAYGVNVGSQYPVYHSPNNYSFTPSPVLFTPLVPDVSCPSNERCFRIPNDCTSSADCDAIIFYEYNSNRGDLDITIGSRHKWVGFSQVPILAQQRMANIRGEVCFNLNDVATMSSFTATRNTRPIFQSIAQGISVVQRVITSNGSVVCRYRRAVEPPAASRSLYYNLNQPHFVVYAFGDQVVQQFPGYHRQGNYSFTQTPVEFVPTPSIDLTQCGVSFICQRLPEGCSTPSSCNALAIFRYNSGANTVDIEIISSRTWVGLGQKPRANGSRMVNIRGQFCGKSSSNTVLFGHFNGNQLTGNGNPQWKNTISDVVLISSEMRADSTISCRFRRPVNVTSSNMDLYSLSSSVQSIFAFGDDINAATMVPSFHGQGNFGSAMVDYLKAPTVVPLDLSQCGRLFTCQRMPEGCATPSACDALAIIRYTTGARDVEIELLTARTWVGLGQKINVNGNRMVNIRGQYCARSSAAVLFGNFNGNGLSGGGNPAWKDSVDGVVLISRETRSDGAISCKFRRPVNVTATNNNDLHSLSTSVLSIIAYGTGLNGDIPGYHGRGKYSSAQVDYLVVSDAKAQAVDIEDNIKAHGILMILAWMFLATCGIFMPRYMKPVLKPRKICGKDAWFPIHQVTMLMCVVVFIAGFIVILVHLDGEWAEEAGTHHWLGLFTVITGLMQPVMAALRPAPDSEKRPIFNWAHRLVGVAAWLLGGLAIVYGLDLKELEDKAAIVFIVAVVVLYLALDLALVATRGKRSAAAVSYTSRDGVHGVENQKVNNEEGTYLQWIFLFLVVSLSLAMTIYHIYIVATGEVGGSS